MKDKVEYLLRKMSEDVNTIREIYSQQYKRRSGKGSYATMGEVENMEAALTRIDSYVGSIEEILLETGKDITSYEDYVGYDTYIDINTFRIVFWRELYRDCKFLIIDNKFRKEG